MSIDDLGNQLSGTRASVASNGQVIAWSNGASWSHNYQRDAYQPLNNLEVREHVILSYSGSVSLSGVYLISDNLTTINIQAQMGNSSQEHLQNLLALPDLTITIEDTTESKIICVCYGCTLQSSNVPLQTAQLANQDVAFYTRRILEYGN